MKNLLPGPIDFLVNYPAKDYASAMLTPETKHLAVYTVTPKASSLYVSPKEGGRGYYAENLSEVEGAVTMELFDPSSSDTDSFTPPAGDYSRKIVKRFGLRRNGKAVLIIDHPRLYLNFHSMSGANVTIEKIYDELKKAPATILPGWQGGEGYYWTALSETLEVAPETALASTLQQIFLAGMPELYIDFICSWAKHSRQILTTIIPLPLAVAGWAREFYSSSNFFHLIVPSATSVHLFTFTDGKCTNYYAPKNDNFAMGEVAGAIEDVNASSTQAGAETPVHIWPSVGFDMEKITQSLRQSGVRNGAVITIQDKNNTPIAATASLSEWVLSKNIEDFTITSEAPNGLDINNPAN